VAQRENALLSGEINAMHTSDPEVVSELRDRTESGEVNGYESDEFGEVSYVMLNSSVPPFDNIKARQAVAYALNFEDFNAILGDGILTQASGPFAPGNIGNLDDSGLPDYDPEEAERLVAGSRRKGRASRSRSPTPRRSNRRPSSRASSSRSRPRPWACASRSSPSTSRH